MKMPVQREDLAEVCRIVGLHSGGGARISEVVETLAAKRQMTTAQARFVVRATLDKGMVRTDRNFRLRSRQTLKPANEEPGAPAGTIGDRPSCL